MDIHLCSSQLKVTRDCLHWPWESSALSLSLSPPLSLSLSLYIIKQLHWKPSRPGEPHRAGPCSLPRAEEPVSIFFFFCTAVDMCKYSMCTRTRLSSYIYILPVCAPKAPTKESIWYCIVNCIFIYQHKKQLCFPQPTELYIFNRSYHKSIQNTN